MGKQPNSLYFGDCLGTNGIPTRFNLTRTFESHLICDAQTKVSHSHKLNASVLILPANKVAS
ncbi:hypothetical protein Cflav_PD5255 [Pedosphaera parvula Ellin514]|uniref:Uncharacterized protein n=1 Tax=Pedosphaera parvula (strain Ellin514) TaxID=320771 RepID=B9XCF2_PEDPL|nr:hypothetical protein Cflav_PD5255 [Pedosphaera parvula Ellin514]